MEEYTQDLPSLIKELTRSDKPKRNGKFRAFLLSNRIPIQSGKMSVDSLHNKYSSVDAPK